MYPGLWPSGAPSVVFYNVWRPQEVKGLTAETSGVGPPNNNKVRKLYVRRSLDVGMLDVGMFGGPEVLPARSTSDESADLSSLSSLSSLASLSSLLLRESIKQHLLLLGGLPPP